MAGSSIEASAFPSSTSLSPPIELGIIPVDGGHQRGKQTVLARLMSLTGWLHSLCEQGILPESCVEHVNFGQCALTDDEFGQVCTFRNDD